MHAADKSPNERYLSITGLVMRQSHHDGYVTRRLNLLKASLFGATPDNPLVLHRRDAMRCEGRFSPLKNEHIRREFDARLAAIVAECVAAAFTVSIDKAEHKERYKVWQYSPYHYVMACLVERFVMWLEKHDRVGDVMGEARNATHDKHLRRAYSRLYKAGNSYNPAERFQARLTTGDLKLVRKGADMAGVQLADALAHPAHRAVKFAKLKEPPPEDYGTFLARILERYVYDRHPERGIRGYGTKWLP